MRYIIIDTASNNDDTLELSSNFYAFMKTVETQSAINLSALFKLIDRLSNSNPTSNRESECYIFGVLQYVKISGGNT